MNWQWTLLKRRARRWVLLGVTWLVIAVAGVAFGAVGDLVWAGQAGGPSSDYGRAVAIDAGGNVFVTGHFGDTADFDPGAGTATLTSAGGIDMFVWKLSLGGSLQWRVAAGSSSGDVGYGVAVDSAGNVVVAGSFQGTVDFNPAEGTTNLTSAGFDDIFVWKLSPSGSLLWARRAGGTSSDWGYAIAVDGEDNVIVTGRFHGTVDFDPGAGTSNLTNGGNEDIFVWKLDPNGTLVWARQAGSTSNETGYGVAVDSDDSVIVTGIFTSTADFDPGAGTHLLTSSGGRDAFVWKLTSGGDLDWVAQVGSTLHDYGHAVAVDSAGNATVTGYFHGTADFDPGAGTSELTTIGTSDTFVWKLDLDGNLVWARQAGGTAAVYGFGVTATPGGEVVVTGLIEEGTVDFDPGSGTSNLTSNGLDDAFVWTLDSSGDLVGIQQLGGTTADHGYGIASDAAGNVLVAGFFTGTVDFDPGPGTSNLTGAPLEGSDFKPTDIFVWKLGPPPGPDPVIRCSGANRYATAAAISALDFPDPDLVDTVFIATGSNFPDAVAGAAVAAKLGAPLLLVTGSGVPAETASELSRLAPETVVILGGIGAISESVATDLSAYGTTVRLAGPSRFDTAVAISQYGFPTDGSVETVFVATGFGFADALAAGPAAAALNGPVLLTPPSGLPDAVAAEISRLGPDLIVVVGGSAVVSDAVLGQLQSLQPNTIRVAGASRYDTAVAISQFAFPDEAPRAYIATGLNFPDALAGAAAAGWRDSPILLVPGSSLPESVADEIVRLGAGTVIILGGNVVVSEYVETALDALMVL